MNPEFNDYIEVFKKLSLKKKKELTIREMKLVITFLNKLKQDLKMPDDILLNKEMLDVEKENASEEDFVEAVFVYINAIKESLAEYLDVTTDFIYEEGY